MIKPKSTKTLLFSACMLACASTYAQRIDFGKIGSSQQAQDQAFKQYWQLNDEEVRRYQNYMQAAGKYRYEKLNPLFVLTIIADNEEDANYYAKKAAVYESKAIRQEIQSAWLISGNMKGELADEMQKFTDNLIGIDTFNYVPPSEQSKKTEKSWTDSDRLVLFVDDRCLSAECLAQFKPAIADIQKSYPKAGLTVVVSGKQHPTADAVKVLSINDDAAKSYDPIEHSYLKPELVNHLWQVTANRQAKVIMQ